MAVSFKGFTNFLTGKVKASLTEIPRNLDHSLLRNRRLVIDGDAVQHSFFRGDVAYPGRMVWGWHDLLADALAINGPEGPPPTVVLPSPDEDGNGWLPDFPAGARLDPGLELLEDRLKWVTSYRRRMADTSGIPSLSADKPSLPPPTSKAPSILRRWNQDQDFWRSLEEIQDTYPPLSTKEVATQSMDVIDRHRRQIAKTLWKRQRSLVNLQTEDKDELIQLLKLMGVRTVRVKDTEAASPKMRRVCASLAKGESGTGDGIIVSASLSPTLYSVAALQFRPELPTSPDAPRPLLPPVIHTLASPSSILSASSLYSQESLIDLATVSLGYTGIVPHVPQISFVRAGEALAAYGGIEKIDRETWKHAFRVVDHVGSWEEWIERTVKARDEFRPREEDLAGLEVVCEGREERDEVSLEKFLKEKVVSRMEMGEEDWTRFADEMEERWKDEDEASLGVDLEKEEAEEGASPRS